MLVVDAATLRQPGRVAAQVGLCETSYRSLWLLVLWEDGKRTGTGGGGGGDGRKIRRQHGEGSAEKPTTAVGSSAAQREVHTCSMMSSVAA